jgi:hypothetical protein
MVAVGKRNIANIQQGFELGCVGIPPELIIQRPIPGNLPVT